MPQWRVVFLLFVVVHCLAGCAWMPSGTPPAIPASAKPSVRIENVPFFPQAAYQCGPAALAMVLQWSGVSATPDQLVPLVYTPERKGTLQPGLITGARRHNRLAYPIYGLQCLVNEIEAGHPVIVLQNLGLSWIPKWHYAVVIGYDLHRNAVLLHTGKHADRQVGMSTFMRTWRRGKQWGLMVLPSDSMPACAEEQPYLKAALGLQQAGYLSSATAAFRAATAKWPQSPEGQMALGNALYAQGLLPEAVQAFQRAVTVDASNGMALNNLAHVLAESGDLETAEVMARRAVALGGSHGHMYRQTLAEILRRKGAPKE